MLDNKNELGNKQFQSINILRLTFFLLFASICCMIFLFIRVSLTKSIFFGFLVWNLFLAWVPYIIALVMTWLYNGIRINLFLKIILCIFGIFWLIFYPNAPYIFSDFIHLINWPNQTVNNELLGGRINFMWFDIILNSSFAFVGHFIGLISIFMIHKIVWNLFNRLFSWIYISIAMLFGGFGIYLGRFIRMNSWDVLVNPLDTIAEIIFHFFDLKALSFSILYGFFIFLTYIALYSFQNIYNDKKSKPGS